MVLCIFATHFNDHRNPPYENQSVGRPWFSRGPWSVSCDLRHPIRFSTGFPGPLTNAHTETRLRWVIVRHKHFKGRCVGHVMQVWGNFWAIGARRAAQANWREAGGGGTVCKCETLSGIRKFESQPVCLEQRKTDHGFIQIMRDCLVTR